MRDVMPALRALVLAESEITDLVGTKVFVNRIPKGEIEAADTFHPPKMLVLRMAGGSGQSDTLPTEDPSITVLCYGESDYEANRVRLAVHKRFKYLSRETWSDVLIHHINETGGVIPLVDPDIVWPAVAQGFTLKADVKE